MFPFTVTFLICAASDVIDLIQYRSKKLAFMYIAFMLLVLIFSTLFFHNIHKQSFSHLVLSLFGIDF